ncbi:hicB family protein [bacterium BMS3Bbin13]|nr:hicB family protein [bacterium BMS3Bbin13]
MIDPHAYNITLRRNEFEGEACFEARVKELPDLAEYGDTFEKAYALAIDAIETTAEVLAEKGKPMPVPQEVANDYSGRVTLRLPKSLHRALAGSAEEEGVSLNQHLVNILAYFSGFSTGAMHISEDFGWEFVSRTSGGKTLSHPNVQLVYSAELNRRTSWRKVG